MAKVKITGHASGTGVLTVTAPNTSSDRTITLPDATGTLLNSDGSAASLTSIPAANITGTLPAISGANLTGLTSSQMPAGSVIQVVSELNNTALVWTDGSQQTAVTDSITVQEGNKVLLNFCATLSNESMGTSSWSNMAFLYLYQDSSSIRELEHDGDLWVNSSNNHRVYNVSGSHLTGALSAGTYAFSLQVDAYEANSFNVNRDDSHPSSMILMEIQV